MPSISSVYTGFPFPMPGDNHDEMNSVVLTGIANPYNNTIVPTTHKLQGKIHKASVSGHLSIATIFSNALQLPGFPKSSFAMIQSGQLGLTFSQIDLISKRLGVIISSLVITPGSDHQVSTNSDGDSVVMIVLEEEDYIDEQIIVLIFAILRLGATYMVVNKKDMTNKDTRAWEQLMALIQPILIITLGDPLDLPTAMRNNLNMVSRDHFDEFQDEEEQLRQTSAIPPQARLSRSQSQPQLNNNSSINVLTLKPTAVAMPVGISKNSSKSSSVTDVDNPAAASSTLVKKIRSSMILKPSTYNPSAISCKVIWDLCMDLKIPNEKEFHLQSFRSDVLVGQRTAFIFPSSSQHWCRLGHKAIRNRIAWERMEFPIRGKEKICLTFSLQDPRSLVQIFNCFIHGKVLILGETGESHNGGFFLRKIKSDVFKNVQRIELTPERLKELLDTATQTGMQSHLSSIKYWFISGSYYSPSLAKRFFQTLKTAEEDNISLITLYGKSECIWCACWNEFTSLAEVGKNIIHEKGRSSKISVGIPSANTTIFILDERKSQFCAMGQRGTICVVGSMVPFNGYCGAPVMGRNNLLFETGDMGRIFQDKQGNVRLFVEDSLKHHQPVAVKGCLLDLEEYARRINQNPVIKESHPFICRRGRDMPVVVIALSPANDQPMTAVQIDGVLEPLEFPVPITPITMLMIPKLHDGQVDMRQLRAAYFKHMGRCSPKQWIPLMPPRPRRSKKKMNSSSGLNNNDEISFEKCVQVICKAVAFSLCRPIPDIIENFNKSFWDIGGTPLRAIMTVKSCLCQGKRLSIEDFVEAKTISELACRLSLAEKNDLKWNQSNGLIRQSFMYSRITRSDHNYINDILLANFSRIFLMDQKGSEKYAEVLLDVFDNSLSTLALASESREIVGIAFNYRGPLRSHFMPQGLQEGFELCNSIMQSCRHLMKGIENRNLAKSYMLVLKTSQIATFGSEFTPPQAMLILRDLLKESLQNAESVGCKGFVVTTVDPVVQEICCSLLGFETLSEIQLNSYKNKKLQKPFIHCDDHQVIGVYFKRLYDHHQYN